MELRFVGFGRADDEHRATPRLMNTTNVCTFLFLLLCATACSSSSPSPSPAPSTTNAPSQPERENPTDASSVYECTHHGLGNASLTTTYTCPNEAAFDACTNGDSTSCTPKNRKPGHVPLGGACKKAYTEESSAAAYELGDDCAPSPKYGGRKTSKGTTCTFGYCTHACTTSADCSDVAPDATCDASAGVCTKN